MGPSGGRRSRGWDVYSPPPTARPGLPGAWHGDRSACRTGSSSSPSAAIAALTVAAVWTVTSGSSTPGPSPAPSAAAGPSATPLLPPRPVVATHAAPTSLGANAPQSPTGRGAQSMLWVAGGSVVGGDDRAEEPDLSHLRARRRRRIVAGHRHRDRRARAGAARLPLGRPGQAPLHPEWPGARPIRRRPPGSPATASTKQASGSSWTRTSRSRSPTAASTPWSWPATRPASCG